MLRSRRVALVAALLSLSCCVALSVSPASALIRVTTTTSFTTAGEYSFTVPPGVTGMSLTAVGAAGGSGCLLPNDVGGEGVSVSDFVTVSPGEQLSIGVGAPGASVTDCTEPAGGAGGTGGGGNGGTGLMRGGAGGGGASVVSAPAVSPGFQPLLVVAGGGGGGGNDAGGAGGNAGGASGASGGASSLACPGGGGGTSTAGGTGGDATTCGGSASADGSAGGSGVGGAGGAGSSDGGGGGGGGYFGGGGGASSASSAGGGGGSSFVAQGTVTATATSQNASVSLTYAAPTADLSTGSLSFASQPQGTASAEQPITVTNNGSAPLIVSGWQLAGPNAGDYVVDDGCQQAVDVGSSCQLGIRFDPQSAGASSATFTLLSNAASPPGAVALSGTGGQLPAGAAGAAGPAGPAGPAGAAGQNGQVELVTCHTVTHTVIKTVHGKHKKVKVTKNVCSTKLVSGPVKFTTAVARAGQALAASAWLRRR